MAAELSRINHWELSITDADRARDAARDAAEHVHDWRVLPDGRMGCAGCPAIAPDEAVA